MSRPSLLMLDEPSLGLAPIVIEQVFERIVELNKRAGLAVLLVEQNSAMALEIASRAFVLETGTITLEGPASALAGDPRIREAYLGGLVWNFFAECELDHSFPQSSPAMCAHRAARADFNVRAGKAVCVIFRRRPCFLGSPRCLDHDAIRLNRIAISSLCSA
jgi:ABC-type glutathione transport system ATPase component